MYSRLGGGGAITRIGHAGPADRTSAYVSVQVGYRFQPLGVAGVQFRGGIVVVAGNLHGFGGGPYLSLGAGF